MITGCSSGFGYVTALKFAREGWRTYAGIRAVNEGSKDLEKAAAQEKLPVKLIKLDVTIQAEVDQAIRQIIKESGRIDVLVNNAGFGYLGPVEDFTIEEIQAQFAVNFFGYIRMAKAVLPQMRKQHSGRIINISSVTGLLTFPVHGVYSSSKFAVEAISEALNFEVRPFGIKVVIIEPGIFITNFDKNRSFARQYLTGDTPYKGLRDPLGKNNANRLRNNNIIKKLTNPEKVANKIFFAATTGSPKLRYKMGADTRIYTIIRKLVPQSLWDWGLHKIYQW